METYSKYARSISRCVALFLATSVLAALFVSQLSGTAGPTLETGLAQAEDFVVLALNNGTLTINSATSINGNVGYCNGVISSTNQKVDLFAGAVFQHSGASVNTKPETFLPSAGFQTGLFVDTLLDQANMDAGAWSNFLASQPPDFVFGDVGDDESLLIMRMGPLTVVQINSLNYKKDSITLIGGPDDVFAINVLGSFNWASSRVILQGGVGSGNVFFNFPNASFINVYKKETSFAGTILAPMGNVDYHNPATFEGRIVARQINLHSDFNISTPTPFRAVPEPPITIGLN